MEGNSSLSPTNNLAYQLYHHPTSEEKATRKERYKDRPDLYDENGDRLYPEVWMNNGADVMALSRAASPGEVLSTSEEDVMRRAKSYGEKMFEERNARVESDDVAIHAAKDKRYENAERYVVKCDAEYLANPTPVGLETKHLAGKSLLQERFRVLKEKSSD
jgi:hypothetical protein